MSNSDYCTVLLIGGPYDGEFRDIPKLWYARTSILLPAYESNPVYSFEAPPIPPSNRYSTIEYRLLRFTDSDGIEGCVAVVQDGKPSSIIKRLIAGYKKS